MLEYWRTGKLELGVLEYWSKINCGFLIADCGFKCQTYRPFKIRNLQSAIRNKSYTILLLVLGFLPRNPDQIEHRNCLFFDHKMHAPVFGTVCLGFACGNGAFSAETDGYQPLSCDAFSN
jgi:anthranilate/para-aminobenzoate synthase component II